jgi:hypothetical protein
MSTLKSSDDHLTLNADGSSKNILFQADGVQKASISSAGLFTSTTIDATALTGNLPALNASSLTSIPAANITGTLPAIDGSSLTGISGGLSEADLWRLNTNTALSPGDTAITANWERADTYGAGNLGTGMTESSGVFSFPSTGYWLIISNVAVGYNGQSRGVSNRLNTTVDDGTWELATKSHGSHYDYDSGDTYITVPANFLFDVTNVSTHKIKLEVGTQHTTQLKGDTTNNQTHITFLKLGDT